METAVAFTEDLIAANHDNLVNDYEYEDEMKAVVESKELEQSITAAVEASGNLKVRKPHGWWIRQEIIPVYMYPVNFPVSPGI